MGETWETDVKVEDTRDARNVVGEVRARDAEVNRADVFGELTAEQVRETASNKRAGESVCGGSITLSALFIQNAIGGLPHARAVEFVEALLSMARETGLSVKLSGRLVKR